jgi:hypothetical protein
MNIACLQLQAQGVRELANSLLDQFMKLQIAKYCALFCMLTLSASAACKDVQTLSTRDIPLIMTDGEFPTVENHSKVLQCRAGNFQLSITQVTKRGAQPTGRSVQSLSLSINGVPLKLPGNDVLLTDQIKRFRWTGKANIYCGDPAILQIGLEMIDDSDATNDVCRGGTFRLLEIETTRRKAKSAGLVCHSGE